MLTKQAIAEFRELYSKKYGETLTDEEATQKANDFLNFYKTILRVPHPKKSDYER